jgi:type II secretory pathway component PulF
MGWGGLVILMSLIAGGAAFIWWSGTPAGRLRVDGWRLRLPGAGTIYLNLALARFTRILGTLLHNGIPILQALKIGKDSTGNRVLTNAIEQAAENVTAGVSLAAPLAACKHFPRDVVEMVAVGEESNRPAGYFQRLGQTDQPAIGALRPAAGAGDASGDGGRDFAGGGCPDAADLQDEQRAALSCWIPSG